MCHYPAEAQIAAFTSKIEYVCKWQTFIIFFDGFFEDERKKLEEKPQKAHHKVILTYNWDILPRSSWTWSQGTRAHPGAAEPLAASTSCLRPSHALSSPHNPSCLPSGGSSHQCLGILLLIHDLVWFANKHAVLFKDANFNNLKHSTSHGPQAFCWGTTQCGRHTWDQVLHLGKGKRSL